MPQLTSIDDLLEQTVALGASDLHVTTDSPPVYRVRGELVRAAGFEPFDPTTTRSLLYRILTTEQQKRLELDRQLDFSYGVPGLARFRVNVYCSASRSRPPSASIPQELKTLEELGLPDGLHQLRRAAARPRPRHRADRLR